MIGDEDDPGARAQAQFVDGGQQPAHRRVRRGDTAVQTGEILADLGCVRQKPGYADQVGIGRLVLVGRIGPMGFEEARREEERPIHPVRDVVGQPFLGACDDVVAA